ncbi:MULTISPECIES: hypothetical protein [unclassified Rathayibacter]|uniref:hypothetical protein n=1 Tax=unclassified Rathayibacter TaxID=2609250 RepID=UPI0006FEC428|nr:MULTISPECIES: hypothetical protein [unclassified Rathayibacter]KQQ06051.1 hypothetical protein ASF42_05855 [Rathayibacter sp. Leaf294]KQS13908.1 hypothetical protein ASG06_05865 [Rathayibacter sp. Leaf185]
MTDPTLVPAIRRAVAIVDFVAFVGVATPAAISAHLGLAKSSIADIVGTMLDTGLLQKVGEGLIAGPAFSRLSAGFVGGSAPIENLRRLWQRHPVLHEHTISLQTLIGTRNLCVDVNLGIHLLPYNPRPGMRTTVWNGSGGDPILHSLSADEIISGVERFHAYTSLAPQARADLGDWVQEHARGAQTELLLSQTGNLEINVALAGSGAPPPSVLTLHLPREMHADFPSLRTALAQLAGRLAEAARNSSPVARTGRLEDPHHPGVPGSE